MDCASSAHGASIPYGVAVLQGRRSSMNDAVAAVLRFFTLGTAVFHFFGVFDGHGGPTVARACKARLPAVLAEEAAAASPAPAAEDVVGWWSWWTGVMTRGFRRVDGEVTGTAAGSTAVVAVVGPRTVVVANCGVSRAVLYSKGEAFPLSQEHKPEREDECKRIEDAGGKVVNWNGHRVWGVLATSRSIGDLHLKPCIIPDPDVIVVNRTEKDEFLVIATDGLWDVLSNKLVGDLTRYCLSGEAARNHPQLAGEQSTDVAAKLLAKTAIIKGGMDNVGVIVVLLKRNGTGEMTSQSTSYVY